MKKLITIAAFVVIATAAFSQQISGITVQGTKNSIYIGEVFQLTAVISPTVVSNSTLTWTSNYPNFATVNSTGQVTGVSAGMVTITATAIDGSNVYGSFQMSVYEVPVNDIQLTPGNSQVLVGNYLYITATVLPTNASNKSVVWSSSNPLIASVDSSGKVIAISEGGVEITATAKDGSGIVKSISLTIINQFIAVQSVYIPIKEQSIQLGQALQIQYTITPSNATNKNVSFVSSNPLIASVNAMGMVNALQVGSSQILITTQDGQKTDTTNITVEPAIIPPTSVEISQNQLNLSPSLIPFKLFAKVLPLNATEKNIVWQVMDTNVVQMKSPGEFIAKGIGTTEISVTTQTGGVSNFCYVTVSSVEAQDITLSKKEITMQLGTTQRLQTYIKPLQTTMKNVYWISTNNATASVNTNGDILAVGEGQTYIIAAVMQSGIADTCLVTVVNEQIVIHKELANATITIGDGQNTKYTISDYITYNGSNEVTFEAISTNPTVARAFVQGNTLGILPYTAGITTIILQATTSSGLTQLVHATFTIESTVAETLCSSLAVSADIHTVTCAGKNDGYAVVSGTGGLAPYSYKWSNFRSDNMLKNVPAGQYHVVVTDANNCITVETITITDPEPIVIHAIVSEPVCGESNGTITLNVQGGSEPFLYAWNVQSALPNIIGLDAGLYSVDVTDANGCVAQKTFELNNTKAPLIFVKDITETNCNPNTGAIDIEVTGGTGTLDYTWSNGSKTEDLSGVAAGNYSVVVTDEDLCKSIAFVTVPTIPFEQPDIALVTVGDTSKLNLIIWNKENTESIDFYTIYRETTIAGVYESIGTKSYTAPSIFDDQTALPNEHSYRYRIAATHYCGEESALSAGKAEYKTINLQTQINPDSVVFIWDSYEGFDFYSYIVYERKNGENLEIARVPSTTNRYVLYTQNGSQTNYFVGIELPKILNPRGLAKIESGPFILAMSNIAEAQSSIAEIALSNMYAYPTIVDSKLTIVFDNQSTINSVQVYTLQGVEVYTSGVVSESKITIPAHTLTSGLYLVKITSGGKHIVQSVVVK